MKKNRFLLAPFILGIILMVYSWVMSYPLSIAFSGDYVFNHVPYLYWLSLPLILVPLYVFSVYSKSSILKCVLSVGFIIILYSLSYFYFTLPTSDSQNFRALTEHFIATKNLDFSQPNRVYFQWPSFFLLSDIVTSISGIELIQFEFLLYTIIGCLLGICLYIYASTAFKNGGFLTVTSFFIGVFYFFNYQSVPFSLAFMMLFILFILDIRQKSASLIITMIALYTSMLFIHAFVPLFFVFYLLARFAISRNKTYGYLFILTLIAYLLVQIILAPQSYIRNIVTIFALPSEYSRIISATLALVSNPIDVIAQFFSRTVTITIIALCFFGFIVLFIKRKMRDIDKAIFLTGIAYAVFGVLFYNLGSRAIPLIFVPISLGLAYLFESRFKSYLRILFLILLVLLTFVPMHSSFYDSYVFYQTKEGYNADIFTLSHHNWTTPSLILAHAPIVEYFRPKLELNEITATAFERDDFDTFPRLTDYDYIFFTVGLALSFSEHNLTLENVIIDEKLNIAYNNGFSYFLSKG